ncbi:MULTISPECIES: archease [Streptomyces]|uniref:Archease n=1 Tax=Streptomyces edwardsiae TaxID=3075527 RepID=A0ABU2Q2T0_9ACTN|nr:archease [Streptomyces sp. DSM 41636]MDT0398738.1 archease [Streptomyces sp. DSM 41636]
MVGDTSEHESGHRAVAQEDEFRIEAWATSRENCLAEAVAAMVECFADVSGVRPTCVGRVRLAEPSDEDLLAALLDEVLCRLEEDGQVPVDVEANETEDGLDIRLALATVTDVRLTASPPTDVAWEDLRIRPGPYGWSCAITVDS